MSPSPQLFYRLHPEAAELYEKAIGSEAELDRIVSDIEVWRKRNGTREVDVEKVVRAVGRFVVEPAAIELARGKGRWWEVYGKGVREEVAARVGRGLVG